MIDSSLNFGSTNDRLNLLNTQNLNQQSGLLSNGTPNEQSTTSIYTNT